MRFLDDADALIHAFGNNSTMVALLANTTAKFTLQHLSNNSTIIVGVSNPVVNDSMQNGFNWYTLIAVGVGFILSQFADYLKHLRDSNALDKRLLSLLILDWRTNQSIIHRNVSLISQDNEAISEARFVVIPLESLEMGFWDLIKYNLPNTLIDGHRLITINEIAVSMNRINEHIKSRENFRINNRALSNANSTRKMYNDTILKEMEILLSLLNSSLPDYDMLIIEAQSWYGKLPTKCISGLFRK